jgi:hypothetical protein
MRYCKAQRRFGESISVSSTHSETLYDVFVRTWQGSRRNLAEAFTDFREALLKAHEYKHLDVVTAFPRRRSESKCGNRS